MAKRLLFISLAVGLLATLLAARIDDALALVGRKRIPMEISADAGSVMVRYRGISSVELSVSQSGTQVAASPAAMLERASRQVWTDDPLAGMVATAWTGPVQHQMLFRQGWPLGAFRASSMPNGELLGGLRVRVRGSDRTVAFTPVWGGLIGNTLLFASVFWIAVSGACRVRRTLRRRAGLCEYCAYCRVGLAAGAACPECGAMEVRLPPHGWSAAGRGRSG